MPIRFDDYLLDEDRYLLERSGERVKLRPKVFDLLTYLVRHRARVVRREELVSELWDTTSVGSGSLSGLVNELRQALGEDGRGPSSIRTVHARGYQFVAVVDDDGVAASRTGDLSHAASPISSLVRRVAERGAEGVLIETGTAASSVAATARSAGTDSPTRRRADPETLASQLIRAAEQTGFEVHALYPPDESQVSPSRFARQVLDSMSRHRNPEAVSAALPLPARRWLEDAWRDRVAGGLSRSPSGPPDPLGSLAAALSGLSRVRPILLLVEDFPRAGRGFARDLVSLQSRLEQAPVLFVLTTARFAEGAACVETFERAERFECWRAPAPVTLALHRSLRALGLAPLPARLVEAIAAHVDGDERGLAAITEWIADGGAFEVRADSESGEGVELAADDPMRGRVERSTTMRRVEPAARSAGIRSLRS